MDGEYARLTPVPSFPLWDRLKRSGAPISFDLELTARCNNDCRHCYVNLDAADREARARELTLPELESIAAQAVDLGVLWVVLTGGEPLLRPDFADVYLMLKRKGLLVSLFTNACLVREEHVALFLKYPPRSVEITVYGATAGTYERVSRRPGSYAAFRRGLDLLMQAGIPVNLKAMAIRSTAHELEEIARFCRERSKDPFRFDPLLHLRYDRDPRRNEEIRAERLTAREIVEIESADEEQRRKGEKFCALPDGFEHAAEGCDRLFHCGAGQGSFHVGYDGYFRLCSSLVHPDCIYDLRTGTLADAYNNFAPRIRDLRSNDAAFASSCRHCSLASLCLWCPAHAWLETGGLDNWCEEFCQVAHARKEAFTRSEAPVTGQADP